MSASPTIPSRQAAKDAEAAKCSPRRARVSLCLRRRALALLAFWRLGVRKESPEMPILSDELTRRGEPL